ncbi:MAG TPA: VOC family protein [Nocardioides sp.]|uniref:VOC family protein n=1 Tax=uncultured Nocardioides sp. TaxID=198441 RepID=UPI00261E304B|nr:VOC family protein [uncultured Nocardioides sp.]HRI94029.1 VOC family protein [Nocardioides sp.]HRK44063.1 VOC family protein [Nocardioides sp.]
MTVSTFFHVGILVRDLTEAIPRFENVLGIKFLTPKPFILSRFVDVAHFGDEDPHPWEGCAVYSHQGPPYYELLEAKGHGVFSLDDRDEGVHHLGMLVEDTHGKTFSMGEKGVEARAKGLGDGGQVRFWYSKPAGLHGVQLELIDDTSRAIEEILAEIESYRR